MIDFSNFNIEVGIFSVVQYSPIFDRDITKMKQIKPQF